MWGASAVLIGMAIGQSTAGGQAAPEGRESFRKQLEAVLPEIIRASRYQFDTLLGARIERYPGRSSWYEAKTYLPGASYCRIDEDPTMVYRCAWEKSAERPDLSRFYTELIAGVEAVLGSGWNRRARPAQWGGGVIFEQKETSRPALLQVLPAAGGAKAGVQLIIVPGRSAF